MNVFVTVGTHSFDDLIRTVDNKEFHIFLKDLKFETLVLQIGNSSKYIPKLIYKNQKEDLTLLKTVTYFTFKKNIDNFIQNADLIISHAGAATTIKSLRLNKKIIIVVNKQLMSNHQMEFATFMHSKNFLEICINLKYIKENIYTCLQKKMYESLPEPTPHKFLQDFNEIIIQKKEEKTRE
ncbi:glycosyltransferase family 28 protein, putative [Hepatocystis sp. ex Piliocolobus tephrosceles]|nr:glycosyltransferase family 28 protein, putative [Hepatocystis sp. ex Piliocolobus tephrosceles]